MANFLASIFGTEQDKVNCSFYYKIGACRHGDRCSRKHVKPSYSQTILMPNLYQNPAFDNKSRMNPSQLQNHFDAFYEDIWCEMCKYGELEELVVCDNNNDHLIGNVYARFKYEESAQKACDDLNSRWYAARPIYCELSPVTDFREACCRLNSGDGCMRGGFCNFIHRKNPSDELDRDMTLSTKKWLKERGRDERASEAREIEVDEQNKEDSNTVAVRRRWTGFLTMEDLVFGRMITAEEEKDKQLGDNGERRVNDGLLHMPEYCKNTTPARDLSRNRARTARQSGRQFPKYDGHRYLHRSERCDHYSPPGQDRCPPISIPDAMAIDDETQSDTAMRLEMEERSRRFAAQLADTDMYGLPLEHKDGEEDYDLDEQAARLEHGSQQDATAEEARSQRLRTRSETPLFVSHWASPSPWQTKTEEEQAEYWGAEQQQKRRLPSPPFSSPQPHGKSKGKVEFYRSSRGGSGGTGNTELLPRYTQFKHVLPPHPPTSTRRGELPNRAAGRVEVKFGLPPNPKPSQQCGPQQTRPEHENTSTGVGVLGIATFSHQPPPARPRRAPSPRPSQHLQGEHRHRSSPRVQFKPGRQGERNRPRLRVGGDRYVPANDEEGSPLRYSRRGQSGERRCAKPTPGPRDWKAKLMDSYRPGRGD
ncbi:uncharacterized protein MKZ38_004802 [Zalerion maritima]|uniref:Uncharacterized protein n=1 Tax=Zalerion maritima TaxID=339359 RepID=A0AAD5RKV5_9PEZI|nr:uncharacterized protein MKZ38_004802 [Zalerion maritima]